MAVIESIKETKQVDKIYEAANVMGLDVIKLIWKQKGYANARLMGFEVPTERSFRQADPLNDDAQEIVLEYGTVFFFPDDNGFRWGYVIGTEKNLNKMVYHLRQPWYKIQDKRVREETIKKAEELGIQTTPVAPPSLHVRKTTREIEAEKKNVDLEAENIQLKKQLIENEKKMKEAESEQAKARLEKAKGPTETGDVDVGEDGQPESTSGKTPGPQKKKKSNNK